MLFKTPRTCKKQKERKVAPKGEERGILCSPPFESASAYAFETHAYGYKKGSWMLHAPHEEEDAKLLSPSLLLFFPFPCIETSLHSVIHCFAGESLEQVLAHHDQKLVFPPSPHICAKDIFSLLFESFDDLLDAESSVIFVAENHISAVIFDSSEKLTLQLEQQVWNHPIKEKILNASLPIHPACPSIKNNFSNSSFLVYESSLSSIQASQMSSSST